MGEPLTDDERVVFKQLTGRDHEPLQRVSELAAVVGRRGGKTSAMGALATYLSSCVDYSDALARGEVGILLCVAQDQRVAKKLLDFVEANLVDSPILAQLIKNRTQNSIELTNNINIEVRPASFRKLRGPTYIAMIADELSFSFTDASSANDKQRNAIEVAKRMIWWFYGSLKEYKLAPSPQQAKVLRARFDRNLQSRQNRLRNT